ncbi:nucleotidyltransferase family protein [soil metagenome]
MTGAVPPGSVVGLLLAAGAGRRMGMAKSQLRGSGGVPYLDAGVGALLDGGCGRVTAVLGAEAEVAVCLLDEAGWSADPRVSVVVATDGHEGRGASLRKGLAALSEAPPEVAAVVVTLVDLPDVTAPVIARLLEGVHGPVGSSTLARASYGGEVGHPVLLGRAHWRELVEVVHGDRGARDYLVDREVELVECGDLATGRDVDRPTDLPR